MGLVLGVDTAGPVAGLALLGPEGVRRAWSARVDRGAEAVLLPVLAEMLHPAGDLDAVAVSVGPGTFTGLRVGVASALGVAFARGVGVVPVSALAARAAIAREPRVLALLDARKGRLYAGLFDTTVLPPVALGPEADLSPDRAVPAGPFVAVGEGAALVAAGIAAAGGVIHPEAARSPAVEVALLGARGQRVDPARLALRYLREPDARRPGAPEPDTRLGTGGCDGADREG